MHILPHISIFLLALSRFASFMLSWCFLLSVQWSLCSCHNTSLDPLLSTFQIHFFLHTVSVMNPLYCTVSCCTMWLSFATLPVIVWKRRRAASPSLSFPSFRSLSVPSVSSVAPLCLPSPQFFVLFFVFLNHFYSSWVAQACNWPMSSVSRWISLGKKKM